MKPPLEVTYQFERHRRKLRSPLAGFASAIESTVNQFPYAASGFPWAQASQLSGGTFDFSAVAAGADPITDGGAETTRLRSVEYNGRTMLELSYDPEGHLSRAAYADGECVQYDWSDTGALTRVELGGGRRIEFKSSPNGQFASVCYPDQLSFRYNYTERAALGECVYPDGRSISLVYDQLGHLVASVHGDTRFEYERRDGSTLSGCSFHDRGKVFRLAGLVRGARTLLSVETVAMPDGRVALNHAVGRWQLAADGKLEEMLSPGGSRRCIRRSPGNRSSSVWGPEGIWTLGFDQSGALASIVNPTGTRTMFWRLLEQRMALAVTPSLVSLHQYDDRGYLQKTRASDGSFAVYQYDRRGAVNKVLTGQGQLSMRHDGTGRLFQVKSATGLIGTLEYGKARHPNAIALRISREDISGQIQEFVDTFWEWSAWRRVLRLNNPTRKES